MGFINKDLNEEIITEFSFQINSVYGYLTKLSSNEFLDLVQRNKEFPSFRNWLNYYLWLFRKDENFLVLINSKEFPNKVILDYIYYSLGKWISKGNDPEDFFMEVTKDITKEKCLQILIEEELIDLDANLAISFLSNLNQNFIHQYFQNDDSTKQIIEFFLNLFNELDDEVVKSFFVKNPELYSYILELFKKEDLLLDKSKKKLQNFHKRFEEDILLLNKVFSLKEIIYKHFNMEKEISKVYFQRNFKRISYLIKHLKKMNQKEETVEILYKHYVIIDKAEKDLIRSILKDDNFIKI